MGVVVAGQGGRFGPGAGGSTAPGSSAGEHVIRITDADGRSIAQSRIVIDAGAIRYADAGGRLRLPLSLLRPGSHALRIAAPGHVALDLRVTVGTTPLDLQVPLQRIGAVVPASTPTPQPVPITLSWGVRPDVPNDASAEFDPADASSAPLVGDVPGDSTDLERTISGSYTGQVSAIVTGAAADAVIYWLVDPHVSTIGQKVGWMSAGNAFMFWFRPAVQATGYYDLYAFIDGEQVGLLTLTVTP